MNEENVKKLQTESSARYFQGVRLGEEIPVFFHQLLHQDVNYFFREGEIVGIESPDTSDSKGAYKTAKVIRKLAGDEETDPQFCSEYLLDLGDGEQMKCSVLFIYKFDRGVEESNEIDHTPRKPTTYDEAVKEVKIILDEAWKRTEGERKQIIRRLYLRWHPDKNLDNPSLATKVMQFILKELEERRKLAISSDWHGYDDIFSQWNSRATRDRNTYSNYRRTSGEQRGYFNWARGGNYFQRHSSHFPYMSPDVKEAKRWLTQSTADMAAAR